MLVSCSDDGGGGPTSPVSLSPQDVTGTWTHTSASGTLTYTLTQSGTAVSGRFVNYAGTTWNVNGTYDAGSGVLTLVHTGGPRLNNTTYTFDVYDQNEMKRVSLEGVTLSDQKIFTRS